MVLTAADQKPQKIFCNGWNRCSSFDNMKLSNFLPVWLETPIDAPKIVYGAFHPRMGCNINETPKGAPLFARVRVV